MFTLKDPQIIELSGADAGPFAQAQFCNDVEALPDGGSQLNAWLNPQGRIRVLFHLLRDSPERYLLLLRGGRAADTATALATFVFRSRLRIAVRQDLRAFGSDCATPLTAQAGAEFAAITWPASSRRWTLLGGAVVDAVEDAPCAAADWAFADINEGLPWLPDTALEQMLPAWLDLERLAAISYRKGCYPGQEIVARMHFRGAGSPRQLVVIRCSNFSPPADGVLRDADGTSLGLVLNRALQDNSTITLAVLPAELAKPGTQWSAAAGNRVEVISAHWHR